MASPDTATIYYLTITDYITGCVNYDTIFVFVSTEFNVFVPTAFSPNLDGFNDELFKPNFTEPLAKTFITAASSIAPPVFQRKGIDLIISAARLLPDCHFSILCKNDYLNPAELPSNVTILEAVPNSIPECRQVLSVLIRKACLLYKSIVAY
jgi:hypothetical protein